MASFKQMHRLATSPTDMIRFMTTGRLPQGTKPTSPLITLLESLHARDLFAIRGVTVDERLGYSGSRIFANAAQALRWAKPGHEVFGSFAADSWRIKTFSTRLTRDDLIACAAQPTVRSQQSEV